jgi:hypothetical protein
MADEYGDDQDDGLQPNEYTCTYAYDSNGWLVLGGPETSTTYFPYDYKSQPSEPHRQKPRVLVRLNDGTFSTLAAYLADKSEPVVVLHEIPPNNNLPVEAPGPDSKLPDDDCDTPTIIDRPRTPD